MRAFEYAAPKPDTNQNAGRVQALDRLARLDPAAPAWEAELSAVSLGLLDAILCADVVALEGTTDPLRDALADVPDDAGRAHEIRGWLLAMLAFTEWSLQRLPSQDELQLIKGSHAHHFLTELLAADRPLGSKDLRELLSTSDSQVSRVGRELMARGLVVQRRIGRTALWELTPRGRQLLHEHPPPAQPAGASGKSGEPRRRAGHRSSAKR